jgi:hypothetical protein
MFFLLSVNIPHKIIMSLFSEINKLAIAIRVFAPQSQKFDEVRNGKMEVKKASFTGT